MSAALLTLIVALGIAVIAVRRRTIATLLVGAQSLALGVGALRSDDLGIAAIVLAAKAVALPALLLMLLRRTPEPRLVPAAAGPLLRLAGAGALALAATVLVPPLGLGDPRIEHGAMALVLVGVAIVVARRPVVFQLLGVIVAENGLSLLAISVRLPYVIELGALLDLGLVVVVAAAFTRRIHEALGTGDTELLRALRD